MRKKDKLINIMKANLMLEQRLSENNLLNELSGDKVMGAAKKMWQNSIGAGSNFDENPRVEKLISDHANKLIGMELFGGEIKATDLDLKSSSSGQAFHLYIYIHSTNSIETGDGKMGAIFYNYSTDQYMYGDANNPKPISGLNDTENKGISRRDARQLYKIAKHFNPNTRYVNYAREIPIKVVNKDKNSYKELDEMDKININEKKNPHTEWVLANSSLTFLIKDFMKNGNVDPEYRELIQAELDNISSKKRSIR